MGQLPTMPVGVDRYLADTAHLTLEEQGVHFRLQIYAWRSPGCCLPDDDARLARMLGISGKRWASLKPAVMALWTLKDGTWVNDQVAREHEFVTGKIEKKRAAGRLGGRPKSLPDNDLGKASGSENDTQAGPRMYWPTWGTLPAARSHPISRLCKSLGATPAMTKACRNFIQYSRNESPFTLHGIHLNQSCLKFALQSNI